MLRRNRLLVTLSLTVLLAIAPLLAGCGDTGKAQEYTIKADDLYDSAAEIAADLDSIKRQTVMVMINNDIGSLIAMEPEIATIDPETGKARKLVDESESYYNRVLGLKDVEDYKTYASMMLEAVQQEKDALALGGDLAKNVLALIESAKAGEPVDLQAYVKTQSGTVNLLEQAEREIRETKREARSFAREKGLI